MRRCLVLTAFLLLIPVSAHAGPPSSSGAVNVWAAANAAVFVQRVNEYAWASALAANERAAAERVATAAHASHSRPSMPSGSGDCANPVVSQAVAMRESGCRWDAYNASGCGGRGCIGFYQEDAGHYYAHSPWNPNVPGACYGLDSSTQEGQTACAERLGPNAWG